MQYSAIRKHAAVGSRELAFATGEALEILEIVTCHEL
jgi:hypothetical protein